ncbi:MAG: acyltransferase domain-containing protein [Eubacteriales bacterium]
MTVSFVEAFYRGIGIPEDYLPDLLYYAGKFSAEEDWGALVDRYMSGACTDINEVLNTAAAIGDRFLCHRFTSHLTFYAFCGEPLLERYRSAGISEEIYWDSMRDLRYKFFECLAVHGVPGTFVGTWHSGFFRMTRFALGRLQYEHASFAEDAYTRCGVTLHRGSDVINCHIPSSGPLTKESRMDSYRRAYDFYRRDFPAGVLPIVCSSWLLYPEHADFLPANSNILSFMGDFDIIRSGVDEKFSNAWRVFGAAAAEPPEKWPRDTSIRRAFAERVCSGGSVGSGYGVILFDGEKILR